MFEWGDFLIWQTRYLMVPRIYPLPTPIAVCEMSVPPRHKMSHSIYRCAVIIVTISGHGTLDANHKHFELAPHTAILVDPSDPEIVSYAPAGDDPWRFIEVLLVAGTPMLIPALTHQYGTLVHLHDFGKTIAFLRAQRSGTSSQIRLPSLSAARLFLEMTESIYDGVEHRPVYNSHLDLAQEAKQFIENDATRISSVEELATRLGVSAGHISRVFHREFGCGIYEYITRVRVEQASTLLANTNASFADIAKRVGIDKLPSFFRTFKRVTGQTPLEYRRGHRQP